MYSYSNHTCLTRGFRSSRITEQPANRPQGRRRDPCPPSKVSRPEGPDGTDRGEQEGLIVHLTPKEFDKLTILSMAQIANARKARGIKLNHPEAVAVISAAALEGAREGKTVEQIMADGQHVLSKDDVMDGVADMLPMIQVEAVCTDGTRLITLHTPIQ